ncbi:hypothetical protein [Mesorhizobium loti]|uniref:hypothetical protein n=1 Tax=Rhizobium loti TaxID=381 RepID=UPI001475CED2|nr:hypothetical protein [Mesorhizobium loti]
MSDGAQATPAPGATIRQQVAARFVVCGSQPRFGRFLMSGIAPPRAPADAMPAFPHVLEKIDTRQDLKWCAAILTVRSLRHDWPADMRYNQGAKKMPPRGNLWEASAFVAAFVQGEVLGMERFEILEEPTGTFSIFDTFTELPATVEGGACIGLYRHEVPLALLAAIETVQPGNFSLLPSLAALNGWRANEDDRSLSDDLLA